MTFDPDIHDRNSIRLRNYDYSKAGVYFITICSHNKLKLFGKINNDTVDLNSAGLMVKKHWLELKNQFPQIQLHAYIIMPNHIHGIIEISKITENSQHKTVGDIIGAFKSLTTNSYILGVKQDGWLPFEGKIWQRNYYEHIIRDRQDYLNTVDYIQDNPKNWSQDDYFL